MRSLPTVLNDASNATETSAAPAAAAASALPPASTDNRPAALGDWYKDAVIYEVHVKAFYDSNGDGVGDFRGLTEKLDYLRDLGVNTLWLLPFYPSPFRDDGYDVADYHNVHPAYGTRADFRAFVREAHRRDLRIITELVLNHTSDQHPWFQAARRAPKGSKKRGFYVWSDDPTKYSGTPIIFSDTEKSNWSWDEVAQQYYWHRFFSHQPDLNFDNPHVRKAMLRTMRFWMDMGVDGFRLDAIPYLIEREGTSNENLPQTHALIKEIRAQLDARHGGRMLLAEANHWPEDVREYFGDGDGDECHMAYHFPLMPRVYMAVAQEDRHPIIDIMRQTPDIPASCQWAIFLRNHDELTLATVTRKERDDMYRVYATDQRARLHLGIRRRLAPLLENDRERLKLVNSLLLSMPGSPIIYYGDEIGMGDNLFLGDRDGVRTPMQWTADRNGGFSRAETQRIYLPPITGTTYGYEHVNVEAQTSDPSSLLNWMRRMLAVRKSVPAFGRGRVAFLHPGNRKILAYLREHEDEVVLCVANLSRTPQPVELDLARFRGRVPIELTGQTKFPPIGDLPYMLTLAAHGFYWFRLALNTPPPEWYADRSQREDLPVLVLFDGWNSLFRDKVLPWRIRLAERTRVQFEREILPPYVAGQRWFAPAAAPAQITVVEHALLEHEQQNWLLTLVTSDSESGRRVHFVPLAAAWEETDEARHRALGAAALAKVRRHDQLGILADASADFAFFQALRSKLEQNAQIAASHGFLRFIGDTRVPMAPFTPDDASSMHVTTTRHNSLVRIGTKACFKLFRHLHPGPEPEVEISLHLSSVAGFAHCVPIAATVEHVGHDGSAGTLALMQPFVAHQGTVGSFAAEHAVRQLDDFATGAYVASAHDNLLLLMRNLGRRVAQLHAALAYDAPGFGVDAVEAADRDAWCEECRRELPSMLALLAALPAAAAPGQPVQRLIAAAPQLSLRMTDATQAVLALPPAALGPRIRVHGNLRLNKVLRTDDDFVFIGFGGYRSHSGNHYSDGDDRREPSAQRRRRATPLADIGSLLHSLDMAAATAFNRALLIRPHTDEAAQLLKAWRLRARQAFADGYAETAVAARLFFDADQLAACNVLLKLFELRAALAEVQAEAGAGAEALNAAILACAFTADIELDETQTQIQIP